MLIIAYTYASVVLVILHYHMLQNKQSQRRSLCNMTSVVVLFCTLNKVKYLDKEDSYKNFLAKKLNCQFK